jgi:hypothetical protein
VVNELTTVAAVYSLAPYMASFAAVGSGAGDAAGLANAFTVAQGLVDTSTGTAPGTGMPAGAVIPVVQLNLIADVVAGCVNSGGGNAGDGTACGSLFSLTQSGSTAPNNTIAALLNLANNPTLNTASLYVLATPTSPFQPVPPSAPQNLAINVTDPNSLGTCPAGVNSFPGSDGILWCSTSSGTIPGAAYFVDQANGSDSNTGTSPATAFATIGEAMSQTYASGQGIGIARNAAQPVYREEIVAPANNFFIASYGIGANPLVTGWTPITTACGTPTLVSGSSDSYQATCTIENAQSDGWLNALVSGTMVSTYGSGCNLDALTGPAYYVSGNGTLSATSVTVCMRTASGSVPDSTWSITARDYGISAAAASTALGTGIGLTVNGVDTSGNLSESGSLRADRNATISNLTASQGNKHNIQFSSGSVLNNVTGKDHFYNQLGNATFIAFDATNPGTTSTVTLNSPACSETVSPGDTECFYGHTGAGYYGTVTINNATVTGTMPAAIGGFVTQHMVVDGGSYTSWIYTGGSSSGTDTNLIENLTGTNINLAYSATDTITGVTLTSPLGVTGNDCSSILISNSQTLSLDLENSSILNQCGTGFQTSIALVGSPTVTNLTVKNNFFLAQPGYNVTYLNDYGTILSSANSTFQGNTYHYPTGEQGIMAFHGTAYIFPSQFATWQGLGYDTTGSIVTP